ncbi:MAG: FKBP-type peptidyl-prolyl cis-trans isomerase [Saprospiraceae bacterium]|nr:FKBP-type peptidyl-prolyl cis-trans isomerase [Saprospiraceae bacterium]
MRYAIFLFSLLLVQACGGSSGANQQEAISTPSFTVTDTLSEEALIDKLSTALSSDTNLLGQERNEIVNHLIDQKKDMDFTNSGLFYRILEPGEGDLLKWADYIKVHYRGYFLNGKEFDSSYQRGDPISFYIGNMIPGWNEGLQLLSPGAKASFIVPSHLAYGEKGFTLGGDQFLVPPNTIIAFDLEVLEKLPDPNQ